MPSTALVSTAYTDAANPTGICVNSLYPAICSVSNLGGVITSGAGNYSTISLTLDLLNSGTEGIVVAPALGTIGTVFPGGSTVGFIVSQPGTSSLSAALEPVVSVSTFNQSLSLENAVSVGSLLQLNIADLVELDSPVTGEYYLSFTTPTDQVNGQFDFDAVELSYSAEVASLLSSLNVYKACVTAPGVTPPVVVTTPIN